MMAAISGLMYITPASCMWNENVNYYTYMYNYMHGNGTYHITQAIWADARLHQFTASEVDNLSKLTLMVE